MGVQYEAAGVPRFSVEQAEGQEQIVIPAPRQIFAMVFLTLWLCIWVAALFNVTATSLQRGFHPFMLAWIGAWLLGGLAVMAILGWMAAGREMLRASPSAGLRIGYGLWRWSRWKNYRPDLIRNLTPHARVPSPWSHARLASMMPSLFGASASTGSLRFAYGGRTVYFGIGLDEAEAKLVLDRLKARLPRSAVAPD